MEAIIAKQNKAKRTFTLRCYSFNNIYAIYRTIPMSKQEFENAYYWTLNDWKQFLKTDEYYKVK